MPSLYIYRLIGEHCPMDIPNTIGKNTNKEGVQIEIINEEHDIDILA